MSDVVRVRVMVSPGVAESLTDRISALLEGDGYEVIEISRPLPCRDLDADKVRVYMTGVKKEQSNENFG
jgi:hypothetical protein